MIKQQAPSRRLLRVLGSTIAAVLAVSALIAVQQVAPQQAKALSNSDFQAGYIISDANFYSTNAMSQAQIQTFLNAQEPGTCGANGCLKSTLWPTTSKAEEISTSNPKTKGNVLCQAYTSAGNETAAAIIFKVQQACDISAKVILVTLQKEEGLVSNASPSANNISIAMGYACPDSSVCNSLYYGLFNQVYSGALQLNIYKEADFGIQPGVHNIDISPVCPGQTVTVNVLNYATAALYNYTPYTPNAALLANIFGTGDGCSSYGNRNFWLFYNQYFGSPTGGVTGALQAVTTGNNTVTVSGWALDPDTSNSINVVISGNGWSNSVSANSANTASQTMFPSSGTNHGFATTIGSAIGAQSICAQGTDPTNGSLTDLGCITVTVPSTLSVASRVSGSDRYATAVAISQKYFPTAPVATVYVASGEDFPDALSVVPVAAMNGDPLLLVQSTTIPAAVQTELSRLKPTNIVVVGGPSAISDGVFANLQTLAANVTRVGGDTRYETSLAVGDLIGHSSKAYIATGINFPDAISAASAAGYQNAPLIVVDGGQSAVSADVLAALVRWGVTDVTIVGGTAVVSAGIASTLMATPGISSVTRLSGADRYDTSLAVNNAVFGSASTSFVATGISYPDGLTGGAISGKLGDPLYLSQSACLPPEVVSKFLLAPAPVAITLFGGTDALQAPLTLYAPCAN
jgi:putative cell wall-binding protein